MANPYSVPKALQTRYDEITALTDRVSAELLNEEYAELARRMAATLARKRPSPLATGTVAVWACGILYALGRVNFLFDKTQTPYLTPAELCAPFKVSQSTASSRAKTILDLLGSMQMDPTWTLPSLLGNNPMVWMVQLSNGLIIDVRHAPRELQEEAFNLGIIPYIPADKQ